MKGTHENIRIAPVIQDIIDYKQEKKSSGVLDVQTSMVDAKATRLSLGLSQTEFSLVYCIPLEDIQGWEQKIREPGPKSRVYLRMIQENPVKVAECLRDV